MFDFKQGEGLYEGLSAPTSALDFPSMVRYDDAKSAIWGGKEAELTFGIGGDGKPVTVDLDSDSPHVLVSAGSGAGKSVIARSLSTQALMKGWNVAFLDIKQISHRWAYNLPGAHYAYTAQEIGDVIRSVGMEVHRRMQVVRNSPFGTDADVGPRIVLLYEELNTTVDTIRSLDKQLPPRGVYKAEDAFGDIMNLGRAVGVHVIAFAQYADSKTLPTKWRESFGYRVLIRHSSNSWNMLAWQCGYCPPAPQHPGRGFVVQGDRAVQTQFLYLEEEEAASLVREMHGRREAVGANRTYTQRQLKRQARHAQRALAQNTGTRI